MKGVLVANKWLHENILWFQLLLQLTQDNFRGDD
jgi:hypothetical protein